MTTWYGVARRWGAGLLFASLLLLASCGDGRKKCYPVSGSVYVDGKPAADILVTLFPADENDPNPVRPVGRAEEGGTFRLSSYVEGDGAPAGEYFVTFEWRERSGLLKNNFDGADRLKGKYATPKNAPRRVTIEKKPNELTRFDLKSN